VNKSFVYKYNMPEDPLGPPTGFFTLGGELWPADLGSSEFVDPKMVTW
jgi:hypothetical protein